MFGNHLLMDAVELFHCINESKGKISISGITINSGETTEIKIKDILS